MSVIVTDQGFAQDDWQDEFIDFQHEEAHDLHTAVDLPSDADPSALAGHLTMVRMIRIDFPSFADGRGFTIARQLRQMGYRGRLRAKGHVLSDQYAMARRVGFDEVEIDPELAKRQPEAEWRFRADWQSHDYQVALGAERLSDTKVGATRLRA